MYAVPHWNTADHGLLHGCLQVGRITRIYWEEMAKKEFLKPDVTKDSFEPTSDGSVEDLFGGVVPVAVEFVGATAVFELGQLLKVTQSMVTIAMHPWGVVLMSKNPLSKGYQLITKAGIKSIRFKTPEDLKDA